MLLLVTYALLFAGLVAVVILKTAGSETSIGSELQEIYAKVEGAHQVDPWVAADLTIVFLIGGLTVTGIAIATVTYGLQLLAKSFLQLVLKDQQRVARAILPKEPKIRWMFSPLVALALSYAVINIHIG